MNTIPRPYIPADCKDLPSRGDRDPLVFLAYVIIGLFVALLALAGPYVAVSGLAGAFLVGRLVWR